MTISQIRACRVLLVIPPTPEVEIDVAVPDREQFGDAGVDPQRSGPFAIGSSSVR
jgi:hypothetical protein